MLREILERTGIEPDRAAALLGINPELFQVWLANQRPIPPSVLTVLSNVVGIDLIPYLQRKIPPQQAEAITPAIWYRFRGDKLVAEDREFVFLIRRLGFFINDLEEITGLKAVGWRTLFQEIRQNVDLQAPPKLQGIQAANMFRVSRGLATGATGIGDVLRANLRSMGVLVVETPVPKSQLEGCCFYVGTRPNDRPCIFANSHHTTWFRRNFVIMHEIAHAIFDAESAGATVDFLGQETNALAEARADAFAQQVLVPRQVLSHVAQRHGIGWRELAPDSLARLCAETHVEKRTLLRAALENEIISQPQHDNFLQLDISSYLPSFTTHALPTHEYIRSIGNAAEKWLGKRDTTIPASTIRLPTAYVKAVLDAFMSTEISRGRAAEMLMIDEAVFQQRFGRLIADEDEPERNLALAF